MKMQQSSGLPWERVRTWAYWLDTPDLGRLGASGFDLLVIDPSADGSAAGTFSAHQIGALRQHRPGRRVVAYLSLGQAESYRGYWQSNWQAGQPDWLGKADPAWPDNFWVHYWQPAWQELIYRSLDAILAAGFDGVYLDRIDAYQESFATGHEQEMVHWVRDLACYARGHAPGGTDFAVFVQNAEELAAVHPGYLEPLTGIAREEVYVRATDLPTRQSERLQVGRDLDRFLQRGKLVLTVEYASQPALVRSAYQWARERGYLPCITDVRLDRLPRNPGCQDDAT